MDKSGLSELYDRHSGSVYRLAYAMCRNKADAEDIMQDTFIRLLGADISFPDERSEKAWLMKVCANRCRDMFRSLSYRRQLNSVQLDEAGLYCETPEESRVFEAVMSLPQSYRIAVHLYYYEGYTIREIAGILGKTETAVQTRLYRARKMLRDILKEELT
ncbi:MAG: RNA polymerase sigma factor [Ruminococcus sp.]|nr:RNA polymerase sigma factor [Ruminococcus sp.]